MLGLDSLASIGYGPEAALLVLVPLGSAGFRYFPDIVIAVLLTLAMLYISYRQTCAAYPNGGGAYVVVADNLGPALGTWAAASLLLDYLLNVAVGIASGVGAVVSAIPSLHSHSLLLCVIVLVTLTAINLRGVRESGLAFTVPVFLFVACLALTVAIGLFRTVGSGGHPAALVPPPPLPHSSNPVGAWVLLTAFANGSTALTGIEAVSNGVPLFREPTVRNAQRTLTVITLLLGTFLLGLAFLCPQYRLVGMAENDPGYQTLLSQLVAAVAGRGIFYYVTLTCIFVVLTYSAQTSFAGFPRVCRVLAEDGYLPPAFANRGRRLVYSHGIIVLSLLSLLLLLVFGGNIDRIIPLFAVGAFSAVFLSQLGMVVHWHKRRDAGFRSKLSYNALGALTTAIALVVIVIAKFTEGAWITVIVVPSVVYLLHRIQKHYTELAHDLDGPLQTMSSSKLAVIVLIETWNRLAEQALFMAYLLSDDVTAVHVRTEKKKQPNLAEAWAKKVQAVVPDRSIPDLRILESPYRLLHEPLVRFIHEFKQTKGDRLVAVLVSELASPRWWENVLHNVRGVAFRMLLYGRDPHGIIVVQVPWSIPERRR